MTSGNFFFLDPYSHEEKLEHIFRYRKIKRKVINTNHPLLESEDSVPEYPLYVTMNPEAITFHFIGLKYLNPSPVPNATPNSQENKSQLRSQLRVQHYETLILPLSPNLQIKDELTEVLKNTISEVLNLNGKLYEINPVFDNTKEISFSNLEELVQFSTSNKNLEWSKLFSTSSYYQLKENKNELLETESEFCANCYQFKEKIYQLELEFSQNEQPFSLKKTTEIEKFAQFLKKLFLEIKSFSKVAFNTPINPPQTQSPKNQTLDKKVIPPFFKKLAKDLVKIPPFSPENKLLLDSWNENDINTLIGILQFDSKSNNYHTISLKIIKLVQFHLAHLINQLFPILPKRELILDFLFDLEHSTIFHHSPYYPIIENKLKECFLVKALFAKCEYYYSRQQWLSIEPPAFPKKFLETPQNVEDLSESSRYINEREWAIKLQESERQYINIINQEGSLDQFFYSNGWFFSVESEMKGVIFNDNPFSSTFEVALQNFKSSKFKWFAYLFFLIALLFFRPEILENFNSWHKYEIWIEGGIILIFLFFIFFSKKNLNILPKRNTDFIPFKRKRWQDFIKTHIESFHYLGKKSKPENPIKSKRALAIYEVQKRKFEQDSYKSQRLVNNFFLQKFNLIYALRNSIPIVHRKFVIIFVSLFLLVGLSMIGRLVLFHICQTKIPENSFWWINYSLSIQWLIYYLFVFGVLIIIGSSFLNICYRYFYLDLNEAGGAKLYISWAILFSLVILSIFSVFDFSINTNVQTTNSRSHFVFAYFTLIYIALFILLYNFKSNVFSKKLAAISILAIVAFCVQNFIVVFLTAIFLYFVIQFISRARKVVQLNYFTFNLVLPRLQMGIISSWVLFIVTDGLWKANTRISTFVLFFGVILLISVAFFYLTYIMLSRAFYLKWRSLFFRAAVLMLYGFLVSFSFGLIAMSILGRKMIYNSGILTEWYEYPAERVIDNSMETLRLCNIELENLSSWHSFCEKEQNHNINYLHTKMTINHDKNHILDSHIRNSLKNQQKELKEGKEHLQFSYWKGDTAIKKPLAIIETDTVYIKDSVRLTIKNNLNSNFLDKVKNSILLEQFDTLTTTEINENFMRYQDSLFLVATQLDDLKLKVIENHDANKAALSNQKEYFMTFEERNHNLMSQLKKSGHFLERDLIYDLGFAQKILNRDWYKDSIDRKIEIFPSLLLLNSVLALFIGIFINVVTQNKGLTEPL